MRLGWIVVVGLSACGPASPQIEAPKSVPSSAPPPAPASPPGALALVLDRSGSMTGAKMEAARNAAHAIVDRLRDDDELAVIAFDSSAKLFVPIARVADRPMIHAQIDSIQPAGGTEFTQALKLATDELSLAGPKSRHVLFMTDGMAPTEGVDACVAALNAIGATLSTIGLGESTDPVLLGRMASLGGGRTWTVVAPHELPEAFRADLGAFLHR